MPVTISIPVLRRRVRLDLRRHRETAGLTQREAAQALGLGEKNIGHYESGRNLPSDDRAEQLLRLYEVADEEVREFLQALTRARGRTPSTAAAVDPEQYGTYAALEQGASAIESYDPLVLNGLVQTTAYAEALMRGHGQGLPDPVIGKRLRARRDRQNVLLGDNPPSLWLVVTESVLRMPVGGTAVLRDQLTRLLELAEQPNIDLQVIPSEVVPSPALHGPFTRLSFPLSDDPGIVYVENRVRGVFFEEPQELQEYARVMSHLRVLAADLADSHRIVETVRKELA